MRQKAYSRRLIAVELILALLLGACGAGGETPTPELSAEEIETQAVATFAAELTATARSLPTATATETEAPTPTLTSTPAGTATAAATAGAAPTGSCYGMTFVSDVSIPDNTQISPGQEFTKTWRVRNSGSCAWQAGFNFSFTGGEAMGGSTVALADAVQPGAEVELSVDLTAPTTPGTYRGNWRMSTAGGVFFGDEVFVLIEVENSTATATQGATNTPTPTATSGPSATPTE